VNNDDYGHLEPLPYSKLFVFQGQDNGPAKWKIAHLKSFEATYFSFGSKPDFAQGRATSVLPPMSDADGETAVPRVSGGKVTLRHQQGQKLIHTPRCYFNRPDNGEPGHVISLCV
jgi:hypothetical protein